MCTTHPIIRASPPSTDIQPNFQTSSNTRNLATIQDGQIVVLEAIARNCTQPKRPQNSDYFKDKMLLMQAQENGAVLDEEELLFLVEHEIHSKVQQSTVIDSNNADIGNSNVIPYEQYLTTNDVFVVPSCASSQ
ncbi:hypothetical protein Tco_0789936 [Tanacetum coccineum]